MFNQQKEKKARRNQETGKCKGEMKGGKKKTLKRKQEEGEEKRKGQTNGGHYKQNKNIASDGVFH